MAITVEENSVVRMERCEILNKDINRNTMGIKVRNVDVWCVRFSTTEICEILVSFPDIFKHNASC